MSEKDLFTRLRNEFESWYEHQKELSYYFTGKDAGNLKALILKIKFIGKEKHKDDGNEWIIDAFKWILEHLDDWTKKNVSIALINSRFNEIIANGRQTISKETRDKFHQNLVAVTKGGNPYNGGANQFSGNSQ